MKYLGFIFLLLLPITRAQVLDTSQVDGFEIVTIAYIVNPDGSVTQANTARYGDTILYRVLVANKSGYTIPRYEMKLDLPFGGNQYVFASAKAMDGFNIYPRLDSLEATNKEAFHPEAMTVFEYQVVFSVDNPTYIPDSSSQENASSVGGFTIVNHFARWEGDYLYVIGEIKNTGNVAAGVEVQVIARDANGVLVDSVSFWPGSTNNIQPGASIGVEYHVSNDPSAKTIELTILGTKVW